MDGWGLYSWVCVGAIAGFERISWPERERPFGLQEKQALESLRGCTEANDESLTSKHVVQCRSIEPAAPEYERIDCRTAGLQCRHAR